MAGWFWLYWLLLIPLFGIFGAIMVKAVSHAVKAEGRAGGENPRTDAYLGRWGERAVLLTSGYTFVCVLIFLAAKAVRLVAHV